MNDEPDDITREIFIAATPDTVFGFLIDPALIMKWIGISHQLEPRPGGIFRVEISAGNIARGIYTQVIRPHRVAFTWGWETHAADLMALADLPPGASFGGDRSHTEGRRNSIAIPSQPPTESIVEIARRTVVYLSRPPQNRGFRPCSRRTARCNQHVARDLISGTQDQEERGAHENPQTNGHIQGLPSASVRHDHGFEEAPIPFWREGQNQPTCWGKIHRLGFSPFGHQFGPEARKKNCSSVACDRLVARLLLDRNFRHHEGQRWFETQIYPIGIPPHRYSGHYRGWIETYWTPMKEIFATGTISESTRRRVHIDRTERINPQKFRRKLSKEV